MRHKLASKVEVGDVIQFFAPRALQNGTFSSERITSRVTGSVVLDDGKIRLHTESNVFAVWTPDSPVLIVRSEDG